ncbi:hypothetical protein [Okeania sp. SIO2C2]|nr:hypothetical protein [Okeania sp. SIO2C2]
MTDTYSAFQLSKPQNCCRSQESEVRSQELGIRSQGSRSSSCQ